jgi:hypothetical protein
MLARLPVLTLHVGKWLALLTAVAIAATSAMAEPEELTAWDMKFLNDKIGIGSASLSMLALTPEEKSCVHSLINRFGPEEKLVQDVTRFLDNVAANRIAASKSPTKCLR